MDDALLPKYRYQPILLLAFLCSALDLNSHSSVSGINSLKISSISTPLECVTKSSTGHTGKFISCHDK